MARYRTIEPPVGVKLCINCGMEQVMARQRCTPCLHYTYRHGRERPPELYEWLAVAKAMPKWCRVCGHGKTVSRKRCNACNLYFKRYGKERPPHLWNVDATCATCQRPLANIRNHSGRCNPCWRWAHEKGQPRPRALWGIGPLGWCECSRPAIVQRDGFNLCAECARE